MKFYKILNKGKFTKMKKFLKELDKQRDENEILYSKIIPFKFEMALKNPYSDRKHHLLPIYTGFEPLDKSLLTNPPIGFKPKDRYPLILVFDKKTKIGKEKAKQIDSLTNYEWNEYHNVLKVKSVFGQRKSASITKAWLSKDESEVFVGFDNHQEVDKQSFEEVTEAYVEERLRNDEFIYDYSF